MNGESFWLSSKKAPRTSGSDGLGALHPGSLAKREKGHPRTPDGPVMEQGSQGAGQLQCGLQSWSPTCPSQALEPEPCDLLLAFLAGQGGCWLRALLSHHYVRQTGVLSA